jgi:hypothetical protein
MSGARTAKIKVDQENMDIAFRRGMKAAKLIYLDNLKKKALQDYELHGEQVVVEKAFQQMKLFIGTSAQKLNSVSLRDFRRFGLGEDIIERIGYIAQQHDNTAVSLKGSAAVAPSPMSRTIIVSEDYYEEDFEEVDEDTTRGRKRVSHTESVFQPKPSPDILPIKANMKLAHPNTASSTSSTPVVRVSAGRRGQTIPTWITNKEWRLGEKIGAGSFGEVYQAMNNKGKLYAVKCLNMIDRHAELSKLWDEIDLMRKLGHKHIVEYIGAYVDTAQATLYIFQEWVPGGSVAHLLKKFGAFSCEVVRNYTRQILVGLSYLHNKNIIHRDIKGGNVLVDDNGVVKLADFGASTRLSSLNMTQETATIQGTPYFMAPEVLASNRYGRKGDIWALGCTMIQMFTGKPS